MSSMPWIKLYTEILNDPKMGRMPDHVWRRAIEIFLIAGEYDQDGILPDIEDMCWKLRIDREELLTCLVELQKADIVDTLEDGTWIVIHFSERQGRPQSEKQEQWRDRQQRFREKKSESNESVTRDNTQDTKVTNPSREDKSREDIDKSTARKTRAAPKQPSELFQIAQALAHVTGLDFEKNKGRLFREAKTYGVGDIAQIQRDYSRDGPWYCFDWRGKRGEHPTLIQIRETWGNLKPNGKPPDNFHPSEVW